MPAFSFVFARSDLAFGRHVFPTGKYRLIRDHLLRDGTVSENALHEPRPISRAELERVHTPAYLDRLERYAATDPASAVRELEVPCYPATLDAFAAMTGGTLLAARLALHDGGGAFHIGGGFHHAFADHGEGFCLYNDVAVATRVLQQSGAIRTAAVIDLDVHQGNGTADIFANDPSVFTLSMHNAEIYPIHRAHRRPEHSAVRPHSTLDVDLRSGIGDAEYLAELRAALPAVWAFESFGEARRPDLAFYVAGVDPFEHDQLGELRLTADGLRERDRAVVAECRERAVPLVVVLAGGYAKQQSDTVRLHVQTARVCREIFG